MGDGPWANAFASDARASTSAVAGVAPTVADDLEIFCQLFEVAPDSVVVIGMDGTIRLVNAQLEKLFGRSRDELIGKSLEILIPERFAAQHAAHQSKYLNEPRLRPMGADLDLLARRRDGTEFPVDIMLSHLETKASRFAFAVIRDITERKKIEDDYHQAHEDAEAANRAKDHFIAVLSHELRTPLTPVLTAVQMIEAEPSLSAELRGWIGIIHRNVELEARLIDDLLDVNKIIRGKLELQLRSVDLNKLVRQACKICEDEINSKQIRLTLIQDAKDHWVRADATRIQQVLWNLLKNAAKFTPLGGAISVRMENLPNNRVSLVIQDTGIGIEPELLPNVFDAFAQGGSGVTRQFGGLGLGLTIARGLVEMHGGTMTATSAGRNQGATFTLVLRTTPANESAVGAIGVAEANEPGHQSYRLLLVEDDTDTGAMLASMLTKNGHSVRLADGVASGLLVAQAEPFDLLISDIGLPDGSGLDLMAQLSVKQPIRGIVLSGYGTDEDKRRTKAAGFAIHLTKPISTAKLLQAVREVMASSNV